MDCISVIKEGDFIIFKFPEQNFTFFRSLEDTWMLMYELYEFINNEVFETFSMDFDYLSINYYPIEYKLLNKVTFKAIDQLQKFLSMILQAFYS